MPSRPGRPRKMDKYGHLIHLKEKDYVRAVYLLRTYGIDLDEYNRMFEEQEGSCAICGKHQIELDRALSVDHCHSSGKVRGLLCNKCNTGIGFFDNNIEVLENSIKYLKKS